MERRLEAVVEGYLIEELAKVGLLGSGTTVERRAGTAQEVDGRSAAEARSCRRRMPKEEAVVARLRAKQRVRAGRREDRRLWRSGCRGLEAGGAATLEGRRRGGDDLLLTDRKSVV